MKERNNKSREVKNQTSQAHGDSREVGFATSQRSKKFANAIRSAKTIRIFGLISSAALMTLIIFTILPVYFKSDSAKSVSPVASETTITIAADESVNLDMIVSSSSGTFSTSSDSDLASFTVTTNNYTGYTLSISGRSSNDEENKVLVNNNTGDTLSSITKAVDSNTFAKPDNTDTLNKWGFITSRYNSSTSTYDYLLDGNYQPAPTKSGFTLDDVSTAGTYNYTIGLGARVDYTKASGVYNNTYNLTAVANPVAYVINYLDNSGDSTVANLPDADASATKLTKVTLSSAIPTRSTYTFKSWCLGTVNASGDYPATTCAGTEYNAGAELDFINQTAPEATNTINLYAVWTPTTFADAYKTAGRSPSGGYYTMQTMATSICSSVTNNQTDTLIDIRDNKTYTAAKINDNCWMTQNLRLGYNASNPNTTTLTLTSANTNIKTNLTNWALYDIAYYWNNGGKYCYGDYNYTTFIGTGNGFIYPCIHSGTDSAGNQSVYYNYQAATAGTIAGTSGTGVEATSDICPAGWKLPSISQSQTIANDTATYASIFKVVYGGYYGSNNPSDVTTRGLWWNSGIAASGPVFSRSGIVYDSGNLSVSDFAGLRFRARYIRCLAK